MPRSRLQPRVTTVRLEPHAVRNRSGNLLRVNQSIIEPQTTQNTQKELSKFLCGLSHCGLPLSFSITSCLIGFSTPPTGWIGTAFGFWLRQLDESELLLVFDSASWMNQNHSVISTPTGGAIRITRWFPLRRAVQSESTPDFLWFIECVVWNWPSCLVKHCFEGTTQVLATHFWESPTLVPCIPAGNAILRLRLTIECRASRLHSKAEPWNELSVLHLRLVS